MIDQTAMAAEIRQIPEVVARFLEREAAGLEAIGATLRRRDPPVIVTSARGSSDNAAAFFKYLAEILIGVPVASVGPSVASLYDAPLKLRGAVVVSVSQSGKSPDIVALQARAKAGGALAIAVVNDASSPLAAGADATIALHAGTERSVAATKTFLASAVALAGLVAQWRGDGGLAAGLARLPETIERAIAADRSFAVPELAAALSAYVVGRGPGYPVAAEAALKLKETAMLHAEAFSGAEVMHGPLQLVEPGFPVVAFHPRDAAHAAMSEATGRLRALGARLLTIEDGPPSADRLPSPSCGEPLIDPLVMLAGFYDLAEQVARRRGHDPDRPTRLKKVTETI